MSPVELQQCTLPPLNDRIAQEKASAAQATHSPDSLSSPFVKSPLVPSLSLSSKLNMNVWLKLEHVQISGSFKSRGLGYAIQQAIKAEPETQFRFFIASGGNAGYAAACAARQYKQACTVCLPESTNTTMVARIKATGACVVTAGKFIAQADQHMQKVLMPESRARGETPFYCHPYNDPMVWEGNASISREIVRQSTSLGFKPDAILCSVGGGGLYNGIVMGLHEAGWNDVPIVAVETEGCCTLRESLKHGEQVNFDAPVTIATSLATRNVTTETIEYALHGQPTTSVVVSDRDAVSACAQFASDHRLLVEPACGAALAPLYDAKTQISDLPLDLKPNSNVVVIVCGGANISWPRLAEFCKEFDVELDC